MCVYHNWNVQADTLPGSTVSIPPKAVNPKHYRTGVLSVCPELIQQSHQFFGNKINLMGRHLTLLCYWPTGTPEITSFYFCTVSTKLYVYHTRKMKIWGEACWSYREPGNYWPGAGCVHLSRKIISHQSAIRADLSNVNTGAMPLFRNTSNSQKVPTPSEGGVLSFIPYSVILGKDKGETYTEWK